MRRLILISLATLVLLAQWGLVAHAYHEHEEEQVCEHCLTHKQLNQALLPASVKSLPFSKTYVPTTFVANNFLAQAPRHYSVRGPPHSL